jgi:hypothetical protein
MQRICTVTGSMRSSAMDAEKARIRVSRKVKALHPVAEAIARNLAEINPIHFIRILPDLLECWTGTRGKKVKIFGFRNSPLPFFRY